MRSMHIQIHGPNKSKTTSTLKSISYTWKAKEPRNFTMKFEGFDPQRVSLSSADFNQLGPMSHDVASYIRGIGVLPTPEEAESLVKQRSVHQREIRETQMRRDRVVTSIKAMCEHLSAVEDVLERKERQVALISSLLAPIRRLPLELLMKIFRLTISNQHPPSRERDPPLLLCRVCTLWRTVALGDPVLWSRIGCRYPVAADHVDIGELHDSDGDEVEPQRDENVNIRAYQRLMQSLALFAERSKNTPLNLSVYNHPTKTIRIPSPSSTLQDCKRSAFDSMLTLFPRCQSLELFSESEWLDSLSRSVTPDMFSQLTSLDLYILREVTENILSPTNLFALSPLRFYYLHSDSLVDLTCISVRHPSIETLSLDLNDINRDRTLQCVARAQLWRNFLMRCTNLRVALIRYMDRTLPDDTVWMPPSQDGFRPLTHLTKLAIRTNLRGSASTLLRDLELPVLKTLTLEADGLSRFSLVPKAAPFIDTIIRTMPYFPTLTALCLVRMAIKEEELFSLLRIMTGLQTLSVLKTVVRSIPAIPARAGPDTKVLLEDSSGLISFLTIDESKLKNEGYVPPLPHLRSIVLFYGGETAGERAPYIAYSRLAHSRYRWMFHRENLHIRRSTVRLSFDKSPFQMCVAVENGEEESRLKAITTALQGAIGPLHDAVLRTESFYSLDSSRGDHCFSFLW